MMKGGGRWGHVGIVEIDEMSPQCWLGFAEEYLKSVYSMCRPLCSSVLTLMERWPWLVVLLRIWRWPDLFLGPIQPPPTPHPPPIHPPSIYPHRCMMRVRVSSCVLAVLTSPCLHSGRRMTQITSAPLVSIFHLNGGHSFAPVCLTCIWSDAPFLLRPRITE